MTTSSLVDCLRRAFSPAGRLCLACLILPAAAVNARAAETAAARAAPLLAAWNPWFWLGYFSNVGSRGNVITLCLVIICLSLFIMMKKFGPGDGPHGRG